MDQILNGVLAGKELTTDQALILLESTTPDSHKAIQETADQLRHQQVGETVTYVINRNINFTNICEQHCSFCAFRRDVNQPGAFWLNLSQILAKTQEAVNQGATEICLQGGLNPQAQLNHSSLTYYLSLIQAIKQEFPQVHLHAFSPQEIEFIARTDHLTFKQVLVSLKNAGVSSLPGTAAEVLDDQVRRIICPEKISTNTWLEIITTAHQLGIPTTSTLLSGHIETPSQIVTHLHHLRQLQKTAINRNYPAKITEFILLPFVGKHAPAPLRHRVGRDQPILNDNLLLTAVARIFLGKYIKNHQPSWVKLGLDGAKEALQWGCNDLGGTLMEEHITTMAGATGGTSQTVETLQKTIQSLHRPFQQRDTLYRDL